MAQRIEPGFEWDWNLGFILSLSVPVMFLFKQVPQSGAALLILLEKVSFLAIGLLDADVKVIYLPHKSGMIYYLTN